MLSTCLTLHVSLPPSKRRPRRQLTYCAAAPLPPAPPSCRHPWITADGWDPSAPPAPLPAAFAPAAAAAAAAAAAVSTAPPSSSSGGAGAGAGGRVDLSAAFEERAYAPGAVLAAPGDAADAVFLIAAGEVELWGPGAPPTAAAAAGAGGAGEQQSWLIEDGSAAAAVAGARAPAGAEERLLAVKGPGDSLGPPCLPPAGAKDAKAAAPAAAAPAAAPRWRVRCVARGRVRAFAAAASELRALAAADPAAAPAVRAIAAQQATDLEVASAMRRLRLLGCRGSSDCGAGGGGGGGGAAEAMDEL